MKTIACAMLVVVFTSLFMSCAIKQENVRGPEIIHQTCPAESMQVVITYVVYDDLGPGFGPNKTGKRPVLGTVAREACFVPEYDALVAWRSNKGYEFYYNEGGEDDFYLLQEKFGDLYKAHQTYSKGLTLPNGKKISEDMTVQIYRIMP